MTEWGKEKLADLLAVSIGGIWGEEEGESEVDVAVVRVTELKAHGRIDPISAVTRSVTQKQLVSRELQEGDLLLEKSGGGPNSPVGRVGYFSQMSTRTVCSNFMQLMRPNPDKVIPKYLFYFLDNFHSNGGTIPMQTATTNIRNIKTPQYMDIDVPLPKISEQQKIVDVLEDYLSRLDAAITDVKQARIKAAQFRKALLHSIFEGIYSETSDTWEKKAIGDFAAVKGGKRLPKGTKWSDEPTLHPYIRATDIKFGQINNKDLVHVSDSIWKSISRYIVEENDVVITIAGTIGEIAVVPQSLAGANLTENAAKLVFDHEYVLPSYLAMYLQSPSVQQEFKELSRATTQAKLALYRIATVEVPVPTIDEQRRIMELLDEKLKYLTSSLNQFSDFESHVASLRRSLLQDAFTGQLTKGVISV